MLLQQSIILTVINFDFVAVTIDIEYVVDTTQYQQLIQSIFSGIKIILLIALIVVVSIRFGSKRSKSNQPPIDSDASITVSFMVACNFLNITNLSDCQNTTKFDMINDNVTTVGSTIPNEIGLLTQLTHLDMYGEGLMGTIPSSIGNLVQLTWLNVFSNSLTGTIPSSLGNLVALTIFSFDYNHFIGTIPSSLGNLVRLTFLGLSENSFTRTIPSSFGNLIQLSTLYLDHNGLTGTIPSSLGNLKRLTFLGLDNNELTGTIPSLLGNLVQLDSLYLYNNRIRGTIPPSLGQLTLLDELYLFNNTKLYGTIPYSLCLVSNLSGYIYIDCNNIVCSCCIDIVDGATC
jgi:Leucine-rich repeat (LRR) protein